MSYLVCKSTIKPVSHNSDLPVSQPPTEKEDTMSVDKRESTGTESERDLINQIPPFNTSLRHSSLIRNP